LNKRGLSLVEVIVALGILAIVFSGTITLVIQTVNLGLSARDRTEAILLAQTVLNEKIIEIEGGCTLKTATGPLPEETRGRYKYIVKYDKSNDYGEGLNEDNFMEISVKVSWLPKGFSTDEEFEISQVVRK
jgi:prepilin-type N-terminal cleavage/methylation domain-containing protein